MKTSDQRPTIQTLFIAIAALLLVACGGPTSEIAGEWELAGLLPMKIQISKDGNAQIVSVADEEPDEDIKESLTFKITKAGENEYNFEMGAEGNAFELKDDKLINKNNPTEIWTKVK